MRCGFDPWVGKNPWRRKWQPTSVFLPGKSHGEKTLVGYSPRDHKESGMTEHTLGEMEKGVLRAGEKKVAQRGKVTLPRSPRVCGAKWNRVLCSQEGGPARYSEL